MFYNYIIKIKLPLCFIYPGGNFSDCSSDADLHTDLHYLSVILYRSPRNDVSESANFADRRHRSGVDGEVDHCCDMNFSALRLDEHNLLMNYSCQIHCCNEFGTYHRSYCYPLNGLPIVLCCRLSVVYYRFRYLDERLRADNIDYCKE